MKAYRFCDCNNLDGDDYREYDISGKDYRLLLKICSRYCDTVSFLINEPECGLASALEEYRIGRPESIDPDYKLLGYGFHDDERRKLLRYYRLCTGLIDLLLLRTGSFFELLRGWGYDNPENPAFYRTDGSIFMYSIIHEGEITLLANDDEDVSDLLSIDGWQEAPPAF